MDNANNIEKNKNYNDDIHSLEFWEQPNALHDPNDPEVVEAMKRIDELLKD